MKRLLFGAVVCLALTTAAALALAGVKWVKFDGPMTAQGARVEVTANSPAGFAFKLHVPTFQVRDVTADGEQWQQISFKNAALHSRAGEPALPVFSRWIAVPQGAEAHVTIKAGAPREMEGVRHLPAQPHQADCYCVDPPAFTIDERLYDEDRLFPGAHYRVAGPFAVRGLSMIRLDIYPVQYNPVAEKALLRSDFDVRLEFRGGKGVFFSDRRGRAFQSIYSLAFNREAFAAEPAPAPQGKSATGAEFVILSAPHLVDAAQDLAEWKTLQGYDVEVYTTDDAGATCNDIKAWLQTAYNTWNPAPEFLLILGDAEFIPPCYQVYGYSGYIGSDLHYGQLEGGDWIPDIALGRISVDTLEEAQRHIGDIINYERTPIVDDGYYTNAWHAAYFQPAGGGYEDRRFLRTSEELYQWFNVVMDDSPFTSHRIYTTDFGVNPKYWSQDEYYNWPPAWWGETGLDSLNIPAELLRTSGFAWDGDAADVTAAVNGGTAWVTHRDHGEETAWSDPGYNVNNVLALTNGDKLPVVWSINCLTGYFDDETGGGYHDLAFTEAWERNPNGGAVGVLGSTRVSYSGPNDRMTWGWTDAMWPDYVPDYPAGQNNAPEWRMGLVLNYGKVYMAGFYPGDSMLDEAVAEFHWYGDPTLEMWAGVPGTLVVDHDPLLPMGAMDFTVGVNVDGALVALTQAGAPLGKAYSNGGSAQITFDGPINSVDNVHLVVTRHQYRPYETDLLVGATADGLVKLDRNVYTESDVIGLMVSDADLIGDGTHTLHIASDSEPAGEDVSCEEFLDSGAFFGEIAVTTAKAAKADGALTIADGDTITVYYHDEDTGSGSPADKTDTAYADTAAPTFAGLVSAVGGDSQVTLTWDAATDLTPPITYQIYRATSSGGQNFSVANATTSALTFVDGDLPNMQNFFYVVRATDALGHQDENTVEQAALTVGPVTIFEEDFDDKSGIPDDWQIVDGGAQGYTWSDENPGARSDDNWSGVFVIADSDDAGSGKVWNDSLITPAIDCAAYSDVRLLFTHAFDYIDGYGDDHAIVDVSGDDGAAWHNVVNWTDDSRSGLEELSVGTYADGQSAVKFRFTYTGNYDYYWGIDNIQVIGTMGVNPAHIGDLTADVTNGAAPLAVHFTAATTGAISGYEWDFGDGETSTEASPTHTYAAIGQYDVTLNVTGPYGDDQLLKAGMITVVCPAPTVDFTGAPTTGAAPLAVQFTNGTTTYDGCDATSYAWTFGDGGTSDQASPAHTYQHKGNFTVALTVENPGGSNEKSRFWYVKVSAPVDDDDDDNDASPDDDDDASPDDDDDASPDDDDDDNDDNDDESPGADDDDDDDAAEDGDDDDDSGCGC